MTYIHELPDWPNLTWNQGALARALVAVRHKQGRHLGKMEALGFELRVEASVTALTQDVVRSSAIEGETLPAGEVRSSIALQLGLDAAGLSTPSRQVEGVVAMTLDATRKYEAPLTAERLHDWHASLFPTGRDGMRRITVGAWRTGSDGPMQVVSGPMGRERIHFEAPVAKRVPDEMQRFLEWFNQTSDIDPVLKAAAAHLWFLTIHPFDDGNGRIARAIADMALSRADGSRDRFYSMSTRIEKERTAYYVHLESAQSGSLDITAWMAWFIGCLDRAIDVADEMLASVLRKARVWNRISPHPINERQRKVVNRMLEHDWEGHLSTSKYARLAKCSRDTALRDIKELLDQGLLARNEGGGRSTSYRLADPEAF